MKPLSPRRLANTADLETRIADLERRLARLQSRFTSPEVPRIAKWYRQTAHGLVAGDVVWFSGDDAKAYKAYGSNGHPPAGVVEKTTTDDFLLVFHGHIDTAAFPAGFGRYLNGDGSLKPIESIAIEIHPPRVILTLTPNGVIVSIDDTEARFTAQVYWGNAEDGTLRGLAYDVNADPATAPPFAGRVTLTQSQPVIQGAVYVLREETYVEADVGNEYRYITVAIYGPNSNQYPAKIATVQSLAGSVPAFALGDVSESYFTDHGNTSTLDDGTTFPVIRHDLATRERSYVVGDEVKVCGIDPTGRPILAPALDELRNVDVSDPPAERDSLTWDDTAKQWVPNAILPTGGTIDQVLTKTGPNPNDLTWGDGGGTGGISSVSLSMVAGHGIGFSDATVGPKDGDTFELDYLPGRDSALAAGEVRKGTLVFASGSGLVDYGGDVFYPLDTVRGFPAATKRNALFLADAATSEPIWSKTIELGDTTNHGASLKIWYASGKYWELNTSGVATWFDSSTKKIEIDTATGIKVTHASGKHVTTDLSGVSTWYDSAAKKIEIDTTNGIKVTYASGKSVGIGTDGKVTCYESATAQCVIDMTTSSMKLTFSNTNTVEIASADFGSKTGLAVKLREIIDCDSSGTAGFRRVLCSDFYTGSG